MTWRLVPAVLVLCLSLLGLSGAQTPRVSSGASTSTRLRDTRRINCICCTEQMNPTSPGVPSDMMRSYWTNFAKTGDPNGAGLPSWPAYSEAKPQMLNIASDNTKAGPIVSEGGLKALDKYFAWPVRLKRSARRLKVTT